MVHFMLKDQLIDFMKSFEREHDEFQLYVTFEHVLLHAKDFKAVTYSEASGIRDLLEYLGRAGWEKTRSVPDRDFSSSQARLNYLHFQ